MPRFLRISNAYESRGANVRVARYELRWGLSDEELASDRAKQNRRLSKLADLLSHAVSGAVDSDDVDSDDVDLIPDDLLARIWSVFGPPRKGRPEEQFYYTFLDTKTHVLFSVASFKGMGPNYTLEGKYDGPLPPPPEPDAQFKPQTSGDSFRSGLEPRRAEEIAAEKELLESARAFEGFLASAKLADCALLVDTDFGLHRIGAKGGRVLNEKVSFADAIDFYVDLVKRYGPKRDTPVYYLAEPQAQIRWLWSDASEADRKLRPEAVEYARRAWQDELEQLRNKIILEASDQSTWALAWNTLDHDAALVGMNTPEVRSELARLREPPPIPTLTDMERATLQSALWVKEASKHWTEADRKERMEEDRRRAAENPEQNPEKIMQRLEQSQGAAERRLAKLLRDALRP